LYRRSHNKPAINITTVVEEQMDQLADVDRVPEDIARAVLDPRAYGEWHELHQKLATLRREHPFARADLEGYDPFWIAAKFADIQEIALRNDVFLSGMGAMQSREELKMNVASSGMFRSVVSMNSPDHLKYRLLTQSWFQPKNIRDLEGRFRNLAKMHVDRLGATGGECDFVRDVAVHYPLMVIMSILGAPMEDEPMLLRLTQQFFGNNDPDMARTPAVESPEEVASARRLVVEEYFGYFLKLAQARRREPTNDVASVVANATIDGNPISDADTLGYYITIAAAGHDTTSSTIANAIWAMAERPELLSAVKANPTLIPNLIEEAVRWTTPVHQFTRKAVQDYTIRGQHVAKGDKVILCYPSGAHDEEVYEAPFEFRLDRPKRQIGFGYGPHMCLGIHLARMEMSIFFQELLPRVETIELAGKPKRTIGNFVGGPKSVPIRFTLAAVA
jgi:cytochrome P450